MTELTTKEIFETTGGDTGFAYDVRTFLRLAWEVQSNDWVSAAATAGNWAANQ